MVAGLSVNDIVDVTITISPTAAGTRNFGALLIAGPSSVIDVTERIRQYSGMTGVSGDFLNTTPEWQAANLFFEQSPQPNILYIGRWAQAATAGILHGGPFNATQQAALLTTLQGITTGSLTISLNGTPHNLTGLDFHLITTLNGAASVLQTALNSALAGTTCTWMPDSNAQFNIVSGTTGVLSTVSFASPEGTGVDVSGTLNLTAATGALTPVPGIAAETPVTCMGILLGATLNNNQVYGTMFAPVNITDISDAAHEAVAGLIQGAQQSYIYGITSNEAGILSSSTTTDLASVMQSLGYSRSFIQYSSTNAYAVASLYGRAFTVDFNAPNSTITLMFKKEPGVIGESLSENSAAALIAKDCNVYVLYNNSTTIIQRGVMCNGYYIDEVQGLDWLQNNVQVNVFNLLYQSPTKIPQTDAGVQQIVNTVNASLQAGVFNGLIAPGVWNSSYEFGKLQDGDTLAAGFYTYAVPVAQQSQAQRETRIAPPITSAVKLAGAIQGAVISIVVNR